MKKLILIMLPLLAIAGKAWGAYVKVGGYELQPGSTHNHSNNSRIDSGTASLSSDAKTLTLTDMMFSTGKATGIEIYSDMTVVLVGFSELKLSSDHHGIIIYQGANVTITGKSLDIIASNRPCIEMFSGSSLKIKNVWSLRLSHVDYLSTYCILGNTAYCGDVTIEDSNVNFELCKNNLLKDLNSFTITGGENTYVTMSNDNKDLLSNVKNMTLGDYIKIVCDYTDPHFSSSAKTLVDANGQPVRYYARFEYENRVLLNQTNFPDNTFRMFIRNSQTLNPDLNDYLTTDEINNITALDVSNKNISNLQGVEFLTKLTSLSCNQTNITALDVSALTELENLSCAYCTNLTSLNLYYYYDTSYGDNHNDAMKTLNVSGTKLTELNLNHFRFLENFSCSGCTSLKSLHLYNCRQLETLTIRGKYGSELKYLDARYALKLKTLDCSNNQLTELYVTNCCSLETLDCSNNKLESLDFSIWYYDDTTSMLKSLNASNNKLTQLEMLNDCPVLETLDISNNQLTSVSLQNCAELTSLNCSNCAATLLSIGSMPKLATLNCEGNPLESLYLLSCPALTDIGSYTVSDLMKVQNTAMTQLAINQANLKTLVVEDCSKLKTLTSEGGNAELSMTISNCQMLQAIDCKNDHVKGLYLSSLPGLKTLDCSNNILTESIELTGCPALETLDISNNQLSQQLDLSACPALKELNCENNNIPILNIADMPSLQTLKAENNPAYNLTVKDCPNLSTLTFTPTMSYMMSFDNTGLTSLTIHDAESMRSFTAVNNLALQTMDCSHNQIMNMTLSNCPALVTLDCSYNPLYTLTIDGTEGGFAELKTIDFSNTTLTKFGLYNCPKLETLDCSSSPNDYSQEMAIINCPALTTFIHTSVHMLTVEHTGLTELVFDGSIYDHDKTVKVDVAENPALETLRWNNSNLSWLSVTDCTALQTIDVSNNKISNMYLTECADNAAVYCQNNQLDESKMTYLMDNLPNMTNRTVPALYVYDASSDTEQNVCTMANVATAMEKGWTVYYFDGTDWLPYSLNTVPTNIDTVSSTVDADDSAPIYNLQGQRVGNDYKGIVIVQSSKGNLHGKNRKKVRR
ncbi:MAG: leucine-rich repeat domain-containing protein [Prevotella sp.]|nr:leucine-rich repeat domain-containing protein [Prevotella sp.]